VGDPGHFAVVRRRNKSQAYGTLADVLCNCSLKHNFANALRRDFAIMRLSMETLLTLSVRYRNVCSCALAFNFVFAPEDGANT